MSNTQFTVPAHIAARISARQQNETPTSAVMSAIINGDYAFPKISIKAGRYRLVEDGVETPIGITLDVVIVGANPRVSKMFYSRPYDGAEGVRPDCFSNDGLTPDASVQNPVSQSCQGCPHNELGSRMLPSGARSKVCSDQRHLAVVPAADPTRVYALTVPVSGMKNLREYFKELQNFNVIPEEVVTELGFDEQVSFPKLTFKLKGFVPEKALARIDELCASDDVKEAVRLIPPRGRAALAAPARPTSEVVVAEVPKTPPVVETPKRASSTTVKPKSEPVKASSELESKLDSLFAE